MTIGSFNAYQEATEQDYERQYFLGRVVNNQDPEGIGRFQVRIPGLYEEGELPWVGGLRYSPFGVGPGFGFYGSPAVGSTAVIELQDGDANMPICKGFILTESDKEAAYTNWYTWGYVDPNGTRLLVDLQARSWTWTHVSGTGYNIDQNGNLTAHVVGNQTITVDGNATLNVQGNNTINVQGNTEIHTQGTTTVTSGGAASLTAPSVLVDSPTSHFTGNVQIDGNLQVNGTTTSLGTIIGTGGFIISGNSGSGTAVITGDLIQTSGIMSSNGIVVHTHVHQDSVGGQTGAPFNP